VIPVSAAVRAAIDLEAKRAEARSQLAIGQRYLADAEPFTRDFAQAQIEYFSGVVEVADFLLLDAPGPMLGSLTPSDEAVEHELREASAYVECPGLRPATLSEERADGRYRMLRWATGDPFAQEPCIFN